MTDTRVRLLRYQSRERGASIGEPEADRNDGTAADGSAIPAILPTYRERAQTLFDHRRARGRSFGDHASVFQEPPWDILLELFLCHEDGMCPPTTSIAYGAGVPRTTALRALKKLKDSGLIDSRVDRLDTRVRRIALTPEAVMMMHSYLDEV